MGKYENKYYEGLKRKKAFVSLKIVMVGLTGKQKLFMKRVFVKTSFH